ncbi:hypothetical protein N7539_000833 [Penicillium diatomitis]|uniref:DUF967 domain protein n=1 Tax=Penicillium diatomitis TaxID=2819901 RepID=A0A9W9XMK1_9EURO|nr:uncharacterized protein N7539_000833 [Penicillium diatomitis]KAJ5495717.1 hypothetical protein N7539_000833 [Penicillium diatomitis]
MALSAPSTDPTTLATQEQSDPYKFQTFTTTTAWALGTALRTRLLSLPSSQRKPALINISLATGTSTPHTLFQCATEPGTIPDNENWVRRKRNTVMRWGLSSWAMRMKMVSGLKAAGGADASASVSADEIEKAFVKKYALGSSCGGAVADEFAIHGGGWPVRVRGVEGIVAVVVVSGLKQEDDHAVVAETIKELVAEGY